MLTDSNNNNNSITSPYKKPTSNNSILLNYHSECPQKYKIAIIKNLIHRVFYISFKTIFYKELTNNIKQTLVNNNFPNKLVDQQIKLYLHNIYKNNTNRINFHCKNQMHYNYKLAITNIIKRHIKSIEKQKQIKLIIYYTKSKTSNLIVRNNNSAKIPLNQTNVIYEFICPFQECGLENKNNNYNGYTTTTLSHHLTYHLFENSAKK